MPEQKKKTLTTGLWGKAPRGHGIRDDEQKMWMLPRFLKHPLTKRMEAADAGLFFRLWPSHVMKLIQMKLDGWAHVEIVRTAKKFWQRQLEAYAQDEALAQQHQELSMQGMQGDAASIQGVPMDLAATLQNAIAGQMGGGPGPDGEESPMEKSIPLSKALSMLDGDDYRSRLENFRGKFFSRDGSRSLHQSYNNRSTKSRYTTQEAKMGINPFRGGFSVFQKGDLPGERNLSPEEAGVQRERTFTRPTLGVTSPALDEKREEEDDDYEVLDLEGR